MIGKILQELEQGQERKSWQRETRIYWWIHVKRNRYWLSRVWRASKEDGNKFDTGMTRKTAKDIAGVTGQIYQVTVNIERIQ